MIIPRLSEKSFQYTSRSVLRYGDSISFDTIINSFKSNFTRMLSKLSRHDANSTADKAILYKCFSYANFESFSRVNRTPPNAEFFVALGIRDLMDYLNENKFVKHYHECEIIKINLCFN